jgi:hypothetical protein
VTLAFVGTTALTIVGTIDWRLSGRRADERRDDRN